MFTMRQSGPSGGDCTAPYDVTLDKDYTLQEFIDAVLSKKDEWGYIYIAKRNCSWYDYPRFEYRYGKVLSTPLMDLNDILKRKIQGISASGGWTRMDYIIKGLEE